MTFLEMVQKAHRDIGIQGVEPTTVVDATGISKRLIDFVADSDTEIQALYEDWDFLRTHVDFTTSADTSTYTTAAISAGVVGKWDVESFAFKPNTSDFRPLDELDFHEWKNTGVRYGTDPTNEPTQFVIDQDESIILVPTPDAAYSMAAEHWAAPIRLALNTDVSLIPPRFHQMVIELATIKYGVYDENGLLITMSNSQYTKTWLPRLEAAKLRGRKRSYASHDTNAVIEVI